MRAWTLTVASFALLVAASMTPAAYAFDLTGHWTGKFSCQGFDGAKFTVSNKSASLAVTQTGNTVAMLASGILYSGTAMPNAAKPDQGEAVLLTCSTSNALGPNQAEIARTTVKTKVGTFKASIKATSVFATNAPLVGTCKYTFKRIDTADPGIAGCL